MILLSILTFLSAAVSSHRLLLPQSIIIPAEPKANSQAYIRTQNISLYSIHASNQTNCRFKTSIIPCECLLDVSDSYVLEENGSLLTKFAVGPPDVQIQVPSNHEMLHELSVYILPKLCLAETFVVRLMHRSLDIFPSEENNWSLVSKSNVTIHNKRTSVLFPCENFANAGYYRISVSSGQNYTIQSEQWILVNRITKTSLRLRNDSIFPHCSSEFGLSWTTAKCAAANLHYRIRILAVPEGNSNHEDRAHYIEEIGIDRGQTALSIRCSQFDIIYEKYCFELVSVNKNSSTFHLWQSTCVSTEPVVRQNGGWSNWSEWSQCSTSCGTGISKRVRYCDNPLPNRGKDCEGEIIETTQCIVKKCPENITVSPPSNNCTCGCVLTGDSGSFFATASVSTICDGNQTWSVLPRSKTTVVDFIVYTDSMARGKLFFFLGAPYEELVWFSGSNQDPAFTLYVERPLFIVLWNKENTTLKLERNGFTILYTIRDPPTQMLVRSSLACHPLCPETVIISLLGVIFMLIIFIPPFICASITQRMRRESSPDLPLLDKKLDNDMIRSGNTECTHVSGGKGSTFIAKRSIGIQLSVQSTPKFSRTCASSDSPVPQGTSSLSATDELEYDYYDGTTIPGSLLAPIHDIMFSEIDIDQIIGQSELFINNVEKQDVHTQI